MPTVCIVDDFRAACQRMMQSGFPSSGDNLVGMEMDVFILLGHLDAIEEGSVEARTQPHAERLIVASCSPAATATIEEAVSAVEGLWNNQLRYSYDAAHAWTTDPAGPRLEFITQIAEGGFYVTGAVQIRA